MRITIDIDDALLAEAQRRVPATTKRALVERALEALIRESAHERLAATGGTMPELGTVARQRRG